MKLEKKLPFVIALLFFVSCLEKPLEANKFRIIGTINGLENGEIYSVKGTQVDTIKVEDGKFQVEAEIMESVQDFYLTKKNPPTYENKDGLPLRIEPSIMNLHIDYDNFNESKLSGSKAQNDYYRLDEILSKIDDKYTAEMQAFNLVREKYSKAQSSGQSEEELKMIEREEFAAKKKLAPMWAEENNAISLFIKENPKSYISMVRFFFLLQDLKYDEAKTQYNSFDPNHTSTQFGKMLSAQIESMKKGVPGVQAGNFNTLDINGKPIKLDDFKGKYLLIDFWASWCLPCREESPYLLTLYTKYKSKGLEILGVSSDDDDTNAWRKAVKKDKTDVWYHVLSGFEEKDNIYQKTNSDKDINEGYNIYDLPTKILVDPDGIIIARYGSGGDKTTQMEKDLARLFEK